MSLRDQCPAPHSVLENQLMKVFKSVSGDLFLDMPIRFEEREKGREKAEPEQSGKGEREAGEMVGERW